MRQPVRIILTHTTAASRTSSAIARAVALQSPTQGTKIGMWERSEVSMRLRTCFFLGLAVVLFGITALAQGRGRTLPHAGKASSVGPSSRVSSPGYRHPRGWSPARSGYFNRGFAFGSPSYWPYGRYTYSPYAAQSYGWPYFGTGYYGSPYAYAPQYNYSDYFPYLYFFDLYYREAQRSKEEADNFEASLRREPPAPSAGPRGVKPESDAYDAIPLSPRAVRVTVDGQEPAPSASGGPLVLGSGRHTLRISAKSPAPPEKGVQN